MTVQFGYPPDKLPSGSSQTAQLSPIGANVLPSNSWQPGGSGGSTSIPFSTVLDFRADYDMGLVFVAGPIVLTADLAGAVAGKGTRITFVGNGVDIPTQPAGASASSGDFGYDNTLAGYRSWCDVWWDGAGVVYQYTKPVPQTVITPPVTPVAPTWSAAPVVNSATVGSPVTFTSGTAAGTPTPTKTYRTTLDGSPIGTANTPYTPISGDVGKALRIIETATNTAGAVDSSSSSPFTVVAASADNSISVTLSPLVSLTAEASNTYLGGAGSGYANYGRAGSLFLASGVDGYIELAHEVASNAASVIGFSTTASPTEATVLQFQAQVSTAANNIRGGTNIAVGAGSAYQSLTPATGTFYRLYREGGVGYIRLSTDNKATWSTVATLGAYAGALYPIWYTITGNRMRGPRYFGLA